MTSKGEALAAVHAAMDSRLFGEGDWLTDRDSSKAVDRLLHEHGFLLRLSDSSSRSTPLGKETDVDLLMCFLGIFTSGKCQPPAVTFKRHHETAHRGAHNAYFTEKDDGSADHASSWKSSSGSAK